MQYTWVVIKLGTRVVTEADGRINTPFLKSLAAQIAPLFFFQAYRFIIVTSGAVASGRAVCNSDSDSVCAAVGQAGLISTYREIFSQHSITVGQVLVTEADLRPESTLAATLHGLARARIIPIVNENDVTRANMESRHLTDNDALASAIANLTKAFRLIILTDVDGVKLDPKSDHTLPTLTEANVSEVQFDSNHAGRGGMRSKVQSCLGCKYSVVWIGNYARLEEVTVSGLLKSEVPLPYWTRCFPSQPNAKISQIPFSERKRLVADILRALPTPDLWHANAKDLRKNENASPRSLLTPEKLSVVTNGIVHYMSSLSDPLGVILTDKTIYGGIALKQVTVPLGRIFIIFESRPDVIPQVVALALLSGNELVLKGGKETFRTNQAMYETIAHILSDHGMDPRTITTITTREEAHEMLVNPKDITVVIPRGSAELVRYVQENSRVPVLAHADGVCHVYVHGEAQLDAALKVILDSKLQYPAVCNSAETILLDRSLKLRPEFAEFVTALEKGGCNIQAGLNFHKDYPQYNVATSYHCEYGDNRITVEWVSDVKAAITHINTHSSHHTECIVTENASVAAQFQSQVDSASVFHNVSTRFADGRRFGLGAEIGIATSKVHARGPVGITGLLSTQYRASSTVPQAVGDYE